MTVKEFLILQERRNRWAEQNFIARMRRAISATVEPLFELIRTDLSSADRRIDDVFSSTKISNALQWLYVDYGFNHYKWFKSKFNLTKQKVSDDFWQQQLAELFAKFGADKVKEIFGTTLELVRPAIKDALRMANEGKSIPEIEKAIRSQIEGVGGVISPGRLRTIARTEVISASNQASYVAIESVKAMGVEVEKKWTTGGKNIRPTHKQAEAQGWIGVDEKFKVGAAYMRHPGDPMVKDHPEEVCNCKCILLYRIKD